MLRAATISGPRLRLVTRRGPGVAMPARAPATTRRIKIPPTPAAVARARLSKAGNAVRQRVSELGPTEKMGNAKFVYGLGGGLLMAGLHSTTGSVNYSYEVKSKSIKDPVDIADFYGGEDSLAAKWAAGFAPEAIAAISFDEEKNQNTRGKLVMATSPAQVEVDGENIDSGEAD